MRPLLFVGIRHQPFGKLGTHGEAKLVLAIVRREVEDRTAHRIDELLRQQFIPMADVEEEWPRSFRAGELIDA
jgi:hypothetical protein